MACRPLSPCHTPSSQASRRLPLVDSVLRRRHLQDKRAKRRRHHGLTSHAANLVLTPDGGDPVHFAATIRDDQVPDGTYRLDLQNEEVSGEPNQEFWSG